MKFLKILEKYQKESASGYTIMEGLVAMIVVSFLMSAVAPVIALSVGTRVQARRLEIATQAARTYVDGVNSGAIAHPKTFGVNPSSLTPISSSGSISCSNDGAYCSDDLGDGNGQLFCVNGDTTPGCQVESLTDMVLHVGSFNPSMFDVGSTDPIYAEGYQLGIRVYRADAFKETGELKREQPSTIVTNAIGDSKAPLISVNTEIAPTTDSYKNLCDRLGGCS